MLRALRLLGVLWLALAQPLGLAMMVCAPEPPVASEHCQHDASGGDDGHPAPTPHSCVSCCCLPGGALASVPEDPSALLRVPVHGEQSEVARRRVRLAAVPHFLPFAIAPPPAA